MTSITFDPTRRLNMAVADDYIVIQEREVTETKKDGTIKKWSDDRVQVTVPELRHILAIARLKPFPGNVHDPAGTKRKRQKLNLPPDPDGENDNRAKWAQKALTAFQKETGADDDTALYDLLCDLMHWCDRNGHTFTNELAHAKRHYMDETFDGGTA